MPLYEYECAVCHKRTEKIQKFSDAPLTTCPHCGAEALAQTITAPAFQFAGGGWYKDGYGNAKPPAASSDTPASDSKPAAPTAASSDSSTPAAPATPAASTPATAAPSTPAKP